jgi:UDP-N-acetylmuramate dehydrogenase
MKTLSLPNLRAAFGDKLQENVSLAAYTSARIGGEADALVVAQSADALVEIVSQLWEMEMPYLLLGGGSNLLVSDAGFRGVVVLNKAKEIRFAENNVWAESGVTMSRLANQATTKGLAGMEWAATVPGTVGGAVYGNAGAFGGDMAGNLIQAELLTEVGRETWSVDDMAYAYRSSKLKRETINAVILSAELKLENGDPAEIQERMRSFIQKRKETQPPGASMGSMFKNPVGDYAGRLIEAAGLKGTRIGNVEISTVHANFFVNHGETKAADVIALVELTQKTVQEKFGVALELEVEIVGE